MERAGTGGIGLFPRMTATARKLLFPITSPPPHLPAAHARGSLSNHALLAGAFLSRNHATAPTPHLAVADCGLETLVCLQSFLRCPNPPYQER